MGRIRVASIVLNRMGIGMAVEDQDRPFLLPLQNAKNQGLPFFCHNLPGLHPCLPEFLFQKIGDLVFAPGYAGNLHHLLQQANLLFPCFFSHLPLASCYFTFA